MMIAWDEFWLGAGRGFWGGGIDLDGIRFGFVFIRRCGGHPRTPEIRLDNAAVGGLLEAVF